MAATLTEDDEMILAVCSLVAVVLSLLGSCCILYHILCLGKKEYGNCCLGKDTFERIMVILSIFDMISSITSAAQPFLTPKGAYALSIGNEVTCRFMGTAQQVSSSSIMYYGILSYYYLLVVRFRVPKDKITRSAEPLFHILGTVFPLVTGIVGFGIDLYGPMEAFPGCWISYYPKGCKEDECIGHIIGWFYVGIWFILFAVSVVVNNVVVYCHISKTYAPRETNQHEAEQARLLRQAATQGFLFVFAFFFTTVPYSVLRVMEAMRAPALERRFFLLWIFQAISLPSIGFLNALIFFRPRFIGARASGNSVLQSIRLAVCNKEQRLWRSSTRENMTVTQEVVPQSSGATPRGSSLPPGLTLALHTVIDGSTEPVMS